MRYTGRGIVTRPYDAVGNVLTDQNQNGIWARTYDGMSRLVTEVGPHFPSGQPLTSVYDPNGNRVQLQCWRGTRTCTYDARNECTLLTDIEGKLMTYTFEARGLLWIQHNPNAKNRVFSYDGKGQVTEIQNGGFAHESYSYDAVGNVVLLD